MNNVEQLVRDYVQKVEVMQLATVRDGQPWCCSVHFATDDNLRFYWASTPQRRHSQEIKDDPRVAAAVAVQAGHGMPPIGIQVEGDAALVEDRAEVKRVLDFYQKKLDKPPKLMADILAGTNPHRVYCLTPRLIVLFDVVTFPDDPRKEWQIA